MAMTALKRIKIDKFNHRNNHMMKNNVFGKLMKNLIKINSYLLR